MSLLQTSSSPPRAPIARPFASPSDLSVIEICTEMRTFCVGNSRALTRSGKTTDERKNMGKVHKILAETNAQDETDKTLSLL